MRWCGYIFKPFRKLISTCSLVAKKARFNALWQCTMQDRSFSNKCYRHRSSVGIDSLDNKNIYYTRTKLLRKVKQFTCAFCPIRLVVFSLICFIIPYGLRSIGYIACNRNKRIHKSISQVFVFACLSFSLNEITNEKYNITLFPPVIVVHTQLFILSYSLNSIEESH